MSIGINKALINKSLLRWTQAKLRSQRLPSFSSLPNPVRVSPFGAVYIDKYYQQIAPTAEHVDRIQRLIASFKDVQDQELINKAFQIAWEGHYGQVRQSGEPYISHPLAVAEIVADWGMGAEEVAAALCHDLIEDQRFINGKIITREFLKENLGPGVLHLVDGITELGKEPDFKGEKPTESSIYYKLLEYGQKDLKEYGLKFPRTIVIKLADRLHNMRTIEAVEPDKRAGKAKETLNVYCLFADILGMWVIKRELEDLSFQYCERKLWVAISRKRRANIEKSAEKIEEIVKNLKETLTEAGMKAGVTTEVRGIYEIYQRMKRRDFTLEELAPSDIWRINVVVPTKTDCYTVLGEIHELYPPAQLEFHDHIAEPHPNGHRFLHTYVKENKIGRLLIHIFDQEMERVNANGVLAEAREREFAWLKGLLSYLNSGKIDETSELHQMIAAMSHPITVTTHTGKRIQMPFGSTALDFAKRINDYVLIHAQDVIINNRPASLDQELNDGDSVFIETSPDSWPKLDWLDWAITPEAIETLQAYFKRWHRSNNEETVEDARQYLSPKTLQYYLPLEDLCKCDYFIAFLKEEGFVNVTDFLLKVGQGEVVKFEKGLLARFLGKYNRELQSKNRSIDKYYLRIKAQDRPGLEENIKGPLTKLGINLALSFAFNYQQGKDKGGLMVLSLEGISGAAGEIHKLQTRTIIKQTKGVIEISDLSTKEAKKVIRQSLNQIKT